MGSGIIPAGRRVEILTLVKEKGLVSVEELAGLFDVSVITIRRDLEQLEKEGQLERIHGGAIYTRHIKTEISYREKDLENHEIKEAIGKQAAMLVEKGDTVFVNSGSTTFQLIKALSEISGIRIVTNNILAAMEITPGADVEIVLIGGTYRINSGCTVGDFAAQTVSQLNAVKTFVGADGISLKNGITSPVSQEAALTRLMIQRTSGPVIVTADSTKIGKVTTFFTADLNRADILVTDSTFDETFRPDFEEAGIEIIKTTIKKNMENNYGVRG
jgi:DeoR family transcriptional regulator, fructose operon transcriptional repressor